MRHWARLAWLLLAVAVTLGLLLGLLVVAGQAGSAVTWRSELDRYLSYVAAQEGVSLRVREAVRAERPQLLTASMGGATYGLRYQTDYSYGGKAISGPPVPYPPGDVWCVALEDQQPHPAGPAGQGRVVFVAWHVDLYRAAWIVHGGAHAPFSPAFLADLKTVGCTFKSIP